MNQRSCPNCGAPLANGFHCVHCGTDWSAPVGSIRGPKYHWAAFVSLGLSFPSIILIWMPYLGVIFSGLSLYLGFDALRSIRKFPEKYQGRIIAIVGMTISACTLAKMIDVFRFFRGMWM